MKNVLLLYFVFTLFNVNAQTNGNNNFNIELVGRLQYSAGVSLNDIWGYSANNKEYALVGTYNGVSIVDVTEPSKPTEIKFISTVNSIWKDIKVYKNYAYIVHGIYNFDKTTNKEITGLYIINLNTIYNDEVKVHTFNLDGKIQSAHNLFIDDSGVAYLFGVNEVGGALMLDLSKTPTNPEFIGTYSGHYLHDGYVKNNMLYGCADKNGYFVVVDINDKANAKELATSVTPNRTTHSAWLSEDEKYLYTTDERTSAYITSFDVSDVDNIKQLDKIRFKKSENSIPHNTIYNNGFLISSYYSQGIQIVDATFPSNMVEIGRYDTSPNEKSEFSGAWGAYPYLPSGNILVSDIETGLHILKPNYIKASYLNGIVKDSATNGIIYNAELTIVDNAETSFTDYEGQAKTGIAKSGSFLVEVKKEGYKTLLATVLFEQGKTKTIEFKLTKISNNLSDELETKIKVYPNPFDSHHFLNVEYSFIDDVDFNAYLVLIDSQGKEVYSVDVENQKGVIVIDKDIPVGVYFVKIFNGTKSSKVVRVVKK